MTVISGLGRFFGGEPPSPVPPPRPRLGGASWPAAVYAIGDVHGCLAQLRLLHEKIFADARGIDGNKLIVCLGDYVDRGPDASGVLDYLGKDLPQDFRRICLAGNHEVMMLDFLENPVLESSWLQFGGLETLASYGIDGDQLAGTFPRERLALLNSHIPREHVAWMRALPAALTLPGVCFVHAGLRPGIALTEQHEDDLLWIRHEFFDAEDDVDTFVVHGHTPAARPVVTHKRICVDTAAFATGTLTAVRLRPDAEPEFIEATAGEIVT
ncbi:metallophosphoesterase family protein [Devosia nitrariae]|uniref:Serine/threonine protein phosphatase n=1 Tax=Devosia nitrariae TaxID=2071872 RepID=A0ABQ5WCW3_9HYPH|nr:metallophosphoesterase family protein [Devosia nitrariae]GLQ57599.1 serine/threonine protein phosphatase [Devosia nitrariae]